MRNAFQPPIAHYLPNFLKPVLLCLLFSCLASAVFAQAGKISGKLVDDKGSGIPYANITLLNAADGELAKAVVADSTGQFVLDEIAPGEYLLRFTAIGFPEKKTETFQVTGENFAKELGSILLPVDSKMLSDVTITSLRPTIVQLADRMVVTVEGTAMAGGSNAYTVLSKSPGVFIDHDGNIQLNGRSGVTVMIDGRPTYLSARDLRTMLEGMSAENIKNIEIITNPSSKHDAEGTSGILNINFKKNVRQGMNGSVYSSYSYNFQQHAFSSGGNINFKSGRWNSFLNVDFARRVGGREATFTRVFFGDTKTTYFDQYAIGNFEVIGPPSVRLGTDFIISDKHSAGFMIHYGTNTADIEFLTETYIGEEPKNPIQFIEADNFTHNTFSNFTTNWHYVGKLDTQGTQFTADLDYVKISNKGYSNFFNYFTDLATNERTEDILYTNTPNGYNIYSGRLDLALPLNKIHKIETGIKASKVTSDNDFRFYFNNNGLEMDPLRTNHFFYKEHIYAAYANWTGNVHPKLSVQAGLRAEQTKSFGISYTTSQETSRDYFDLFPTLFVQQKVNDNYGINYSYSRRLTRPNYGSLNPFKAYRDPYTWIEGNPFLRPQYTHSFSIAQSFKKVYILTASYQLNKDVMAEIPILDVDNATTIYTTGNVDDGHNMSLTGVAPLKITRKWDSQNTLLLSYAKFTMMSNNGEVVNDQLFYMIQSNHTIHLPQEIRMELNLLYRGPGASGLYHLAAMNRVDIAFKKSFLNKKLDLTLNANDIFKGYRFFWTTDINGNVNEFDQYFRFRSIGLSLRYNFSKGQKTDQRRNNNLEELNRTGG